MKTVLFRIFFVLLLLQTNSGLVGQPQPVEINIRQIDIQGTTSLAVLAYDSGKLSSSGQKLDKLTEGSLSRAIKANRFEGKPGETVEILAPKHFHGERIILIGVGKPEELSTIQVKSIVGEFPTKATQLHLAIDPIKEATLKSEEIAAHFAFGLLLGSYSFNRYKTMDKEEEPSSLSKLSLMLNNRKQARTLFHELDKVSAGVFLARDLVNEPGNVVYPETVVRQSKKLEALGVEIKALGPEQIKKLGMSAVLGVGQGSMHETHLLTMQWRGGKKSTPLIALTGKGITF